MKYYSGLCLIWFEGLSGIHWSIIPFGNSCMFSNNQCLHLCYQIYRIEQDHLHHVQESQSTVSPEAPTFGLCFFGTIDHRGNPLATCPQLLMDNLVESDPYVQSYYNVLPYLWHGYYPLPISNRHQYACIPADNNRSLPLIS